MDYVTVGLAPTAGISRERRLIALRQRTETLSDRQVHDGVSSKEHPKKAYLPFWATKCGAVITYDV
jgi:hypothetical protein